MYCRMVFGFVWFTLIILLISHEFVNVELQFSSYLVSHLFICWGYLGRGFYGTGNQMTWHFGAGHFTIHILDVIRGFSGMCTLLASCHMWSHWQQQWTAWCSWGVIVLWMRNYKTKTRSVIRYIISTKTESPDSYLSYTIIQWRHFIIRSIAYFCYETALFHKTFLEMRGQPGATHWPWWTYPRDVFSRRLSWRGSTI